MTELASKIVYIAGICAALYGIWQFIVRPIRWTKTKKQELAEERDDRIQEELTKALQPISADIDELSKSIKEIREINLKQTEQLEWMNRATLDLLRQEIMYLYKHHFPDKRLTIDENKQLHKLYQDYKDGGGNSFIDDLYNQMTVWEIIPNHTDK